MLKDNVALTMSVTRRVLERRRGTGRDGMRPAGVDQQGSRRSRVSREGTREAVRSMLPIGQLRKRTMAVSHVTLNPERWRSWTIDCELCWNDSENATP